MKMPRYIVQAALGFPIIYFLRLLGLDMGGRLCAALVKLIAPFTAENKTVKRNLALIYPHLSADEIDHLAVKIWDNFGRTMGEFVSLNKIRDQHKRRIDIENPELLHQLAQEKNGVIFFSAHIANWNAAAIAINVLDMPITAIYRQANNPFFKNWVKHIYNSVSGDTECIPKGKDGAKVLVSRLKKNGGVFMLVDQKMNQGVGVQFLGHPANSPSAPASMARRYGAKLVMVSCERVSGCHFKVKFHPPFMADNTDDIAGDIKNTTQKINDHLAEMIHARPEQWMSWAHKRW